MSGVKNTIRLRVDPAKKDSIDLAYVVFDVLEGLAGVNRSEVFCLQDFPKRGLYDVTFHQEDRCHAFLDCLRIHKRSPVLEHIRFFPLFGGRERPMTVHLFNPFADIKVVMTYLEKYFDSIRGGVKQQNVYGIFNGKYKLWVRLKVDPACASGVRHPPATFCFGGIRGFLAYPGQPSFRKKLSPPRYCLFQKTCHSCGQLFHDGGDPQGCDFCGHLFTEYPGVKSEEEAMVGHAATMEDRKAEEDQPTKTGRVNGVPMGDGGETASGDTIRVIEWKILAHPSDP